MGSWLRNPRTKQEKQANGYRCGIVHFDDYEVKLRAKRGAGNLVDNWHDISRQDLKHRSWKRHRDKQYKNE